MKMRPMIRGSTQVAQQSTEQANFRKLGPKNGNSGGIGGGVRF